LKPPATTSIINKQLIIVAHSARALAQSASRAGYEVIAVDGFADIDTQQACSACWCVPLKEGHFNVSKLTACLQVLYKKYPQSYVLLGPGGEFHTSFIELNLPNWPLLGNTSKTIRQVTEPTEFFAQLDQLNIPYPEISLTPAKPESGSWLCKSIYSCGGVGVAKIAHANERRTASYYWQREIIGVPISALVITDGRQYRIIGFNRQFVCHHSEQRPYVYSGAIANIELSEDITKKTRSYINKIISNFNLIGIFSLDMLLVEQALFVLEVNPRISSTYELYERIQDELNLVDAHIRVCEGDALCEFATMTALSGQRIVYAKQNGIAGGMTWPNWTSDQPNVNQSIQQGDPICSVFAVGDDYDSVHRRLEERAQQVLGLLY
jgi:predicted ATP-grasp superfamily ATP-dependent carboligase